MSQDGVGLSALNTMSELSQSMNKTGSPGALVGDP
jgi:hypothetical protein